MNEIFIESGGIQVPVLQLELISARNQVVLGNADKDLILRTAGSIKIQVGNNFYDLPFNSNNGDVTLGNTVILNTTADLLTLTYPGDGTLVYVSSTGTLYIANNGVYETINKDTVDGDDPTIPTNKVYLSYQEDQTLTGEEKYRVVINTGEIIPSLADLSNYLQENVYEGQVVFSIEEGKHYQLVNAALPQLPQSWQELYLSLQTGGIVKGNVAIDPSGNTTRNFASLYLAGFQDSTQLTPNQLALNGLFLGSSDLTSGLGIWTDSDGNTVFSNQKDSIYNGIKFLTNGANDTPYNPLTLYGPNVAIGGLIDYGYGLTIHSRTLFKNQAYFVSGMQSPEFQTGIDGLGFSLAKDSLNKWTLEVDNLIVRNKNSAARYSTTGIEGAELLNYDIDLNEVVLLEEIPVYIKATVAGKFSDTSGTVIPFSARGNKAYVKRMPLADITGDDLTQNYEVIDLAFGIGDYDNSLTLISGTTYVQDSTGYITIPPTHSWDGTNFIPNSGGDLVEIDRINVYYCTTTTTLAVGDLLYYKEWNVNKEVMYIVPVEVVAVDNGTYYLYVYNNQEINNESTLIRVGNRTSGGSLIQLNSSDNTSPMIEYASGITNLNQLFTGFSYIDDTIVNSRTDSAINQTNLRTKIGNLSNIIYSDLGLNNTNTNGLYSDNAYLKGKFVADTLKFTTLPASSGAYKMVVRNTSTGFAEYIDGIDLSAYVPYTGATGDVNLGTHNLTADWLFATTRARIGTLAGSYTDFQPGIGTFYNSGSDQTNITGGAVYTNSIELRKDGLNSTIINAAPLTGGVFNQRILQVPNYTGTRTIATTADLSPYLTTSTAATTYVPYVGATATLELGNQQLTGTNGTYQYTLIPEGSFYSSGHELNIGNAADDDDYAGGRLQINGSYTDLTGLVSASVQLGDGGDLIFKVYNGATRSVAFGPSVGGTWYTGLRIYNSSQYIGLPATPATATTGYHYLVRDDSTGVVKQVSGGGGSSITLTTTGTSGPATLISDVLNIPEYSSGGGSVDYEEGTWTPSNTYLGSTTSATFTRVGRAVTVSFRVTISSNGSGSEFILGGLPYEPMTTASNRSYTMPVQYSGGGNFTAVCTSDSGGRIQGFTHPDGTVKQNTDFGGFTLWGTCTYECYIEPL